MRGGCSAVTAAAVAIIRSATPIPDAIPPPSSVALLVALSAHPARPLPLIEYQTAAPAHGCRWAADSGERRAPSDGGSATTGALAASHWLLPGGCGGAMLGGRRKGKG